MFEGQMTAVGDGELGQPVEIQILNQSHRLSLMMMMMTCGVI